MGKNCVLCGKDVSKWNLDFTRDIECDDCTMKKVLRVEREERAKEMRVRQIGSDLSNARKALGLSQQQLAVKWGVKRQYVSQMEHGIRPLSEQAENLIKEVTRKHPIPEVGNGDLLADLPLKTKDLDVSKMAVRDYLEWHGLLGKDLDANIRRGIEIRLKRGNNFGSPIKDVAGNWEGYANEE